ncbi:MAG: hypothetical protein IPP71_22210 [Bacteroidetes bacterium]|nr:hypothetical protein [Bacteroidota bacterium]
MKKISTTIILLIAVMMTNVQTANAQWTIANLSAPRTSLCYRCWHQSFFAGGVNVSPFNPYSVVDIYDNGTGLWTTANLSVARKNLSATAVGSKAFFAGGIGTNSSSVVDIYNNSTGLWTTANLSAARSHLSATAVGTKAFFAGGVFSNNTTSSIVDIWNNSNGVWTTAKLSVARRNLSAATLDTKVFLQEAESSSFFLQ